MSGRFVLKPIKRKSIGSDLSNKLFGRFLEQFEVPQIDGERRLGKRFRQHILVRHFL